MVQTLSLNAAEDKNNKVLVEDKMIKVVPVGMLQENAYFFIDETSKHGFLIDPGAEADKLLAVIKREGYVIEKILITHGHFDHIGAVMALKEQLKCPVIAHTESSSYLDNPAWNLSSVYGAGFTVEADVFVEHGDRVTLEENEKMNMQVIFAPGHSSDGVAYYNANEGIAFVGDIIFREGVGRADNPGGNMNRLLSSIKAQIFTFPDETVLYTGHGVPTTVGYEKINNPMFNIFD